MSIFDMFRSAPAAPAQQPAQQQQQPTNPGNLPGAPTVPVDTNNGAAPNGTVPLDPGTAAKPDSQLEQFKTLWEPVVTDPANNKPAGISSLNPEDVQKVIAKVDFASALDPANLAAIAAGGESAQKAFVDSLNSVAKQVLLHSTLVGNKLTERAVQEALAAQESKLPAMMRSQSVAQHIKDINPLFSNPAVKPVVDATRTQLEQRYPNATPNEIALMLNNYLTAMSESLAPKKESKAGQGTDDLDWEALLS